MTNTTAASKYIPMRPRISINWNPPFQTSLHKISKEVFFWLTIFFFRNNFCSVFYVKQKKISERSENFWKFLFLKIYFIKKVWKGGFQLMLILGLLGMYFDAAVVFVTNSSLLFRLAVAILCVVIEWSQSTMVWVTIANCLRCYRGLERGRILDK